MAEAQAGGAAFDATSSIGSGYVQAAAMRAQADYEMKLAELNNKTLDYEISATEAQGADAITRGGQAAARRAQRARLQASAQRASMAAGGGDISQEVVDQTLAIGAADEAAIKVNSYREAFGFVTRANQLRGAQAANTLQSRSRANALEYGARSSIITGWAGGVSSGFKAASHLKGGK